MKHLLAVLILSALSAYPQSNPQPSVIVVKVPTRELATLLHQPTSNTDDLEVFISGLNPDVAAVRVTVEYAYAGISGRYVGVVSVDSLGANALVVIPFVDVFQLSVFHVQIEPLIAASPLDFPQ
jgi:hypothetical protein